MRRFKNILVHCDEPGAYAALFDRVAWLARTNDATVTLVDVVDTEKGRLASALGASRNGGAAVEAIAEAHRERLNEVAAKLSAHGVEARAVVLQGSPTLEVIRQVLREKHDLVMKAAQPAPGWPLLTGLDMHLIRKCPSAVWITKSSAPPRSERILAAVDPDPSDAERDRLNRTVLQLATSLAAADEAKLDVLNAWSFPEETTLRRTRASTPSVEVDRLVDEYRRASEWRLQSLCAEFAGAPTPMRVLHLKGLPADTIPEHATSDGVDTIVMGTVARTGVTGLFIGNTAETILNRVNCSVLTVKPEGFVSPITLNA